jgi:hypothetical protein
MIMILLLPPSIKGLFRKICDTFLWTEIVLFPLLNISKIYTSNQTNIRNHSIIVSRASQRTEKSHLRHIYTTAQGTDSLVDLGFSQIELLWRLAVVTKVGTHAINNPSDVAVTSFVFLGDAWCVALGRVAVSFEGLAGPFAWRMFLACSNNTVN